MDVELGRRKNMTNLEERFREVRESGEEKK